MFSEICVDCYVIFFLVREEEDCGLKECRSGVANDPTEPGQDVVGED